MKVIEDICDICNNDGIVVTRLPNKDFYLKICLDCFTKYAKNKDKFIGQCDNCQKSGNVVVKKIKEFSLLGQDIKTKFLGNLCMNCLKEKIEYLKKEIEKHNTIKKRLVLIVNEYLASRVPLSKNLGRYFCLPFNQQDKFRFGGIDETMVKMYEGFIKNPSNSYRLYYTNDIDKFGCLLIIKHKGLIEIPESKVWDENYDEAAEAFILKLQSIK